MNTNFNIIGLTRLGIKPQSIAPEGNALIPRPLELLKWKETITHAVVTSPDGEGKQASAKIFLQKCSKRFSVAVA